jgi:hypothetical protein
VKKEGMMMGMSAAERTNKGEVKVKFEVPETASAVNFVFFRFSFSEC